jgi:hypothetical protein
MRRCLRVTAACVATAVLVVAYPSADTILVPEAIATIQQALVAAVSGDTISVAPGVYSGYGFNHLDFAGKSVILYGRGGPTRTILDMFYAQGFYFHSGEPPEAVVDGFTITRGVSFSVGGGVYCTNGSSPTFRNCLIAHCEAVGYPFTWGGGIACDLGAAPLFENCTITANYAWDELPGDEGGGICCNGASATLVRCILWGNYLGDAVTIRATDTINFLCSAVDTTGISGPGAIEYMGEMVFVDPRFCDPQPYYPPIVADPLNYHLWIDSPCLSWVSPCGELIGAFPVGCPMASAPEAQWRNAPADDHAPLKVLGPQPATTGVEMRLEALLGAEVYISIYDARGALVKTLLKPQAGAAPLALHWDLTDANGRAVGPGVYFVRVASPRGRGSVRVIVVR